MTIRNVVVADEHDRGDGKTWIVRWDGGDSTAMTEEEADQLAAGVSQVAALRAELDVARADADRAEGDLPAEIRSLRAELETVKKERDEQQKRGDRYAGELNAARSPDTAIRVPCVVRSVAPTEIKAELETAETLRASANAEIERLAASIEQREQEHGALLAELETARRDVMEQARMKFEASRWGDVARDKLQVVEAELETARADWAVIAQSERERLAAVRAVAVEEAAQKVALDWTDTFDRRVIADRLRALAPLDPALCVVAKETVEQVRGALERAAALAQPQEALMYIAALKALEAGR